MRRTMGEFRGFSSSEAFAHHFPCYDVLSRNLFGIVLERAKEAIFFRDIPPFVESLTIFSDHPERFIRWFLFLSVFRKSCDFSLFCKSNSLQIVKTLLISKIMKKHMIVETQNGTEIIK